MFKPKPLKPVILAYAFKLYFGLVRWLGSIFKQIFSLQGYIVVTFKQFYRFLDSFVVNFRQIYRLRETIVVTFNQILVLKGSIDATQKQNRKLIGMVRFIPIILHFLRDSVDVALTKIGKLRAVAVVTLISVGLSITFLVVVSAPTVLADTNSTVNFQARLENAAGAIVPDGNYNVEFKLYNAATEPGGHTPDQGACTYNGGSTDNTCLWTETRTYNSGPSSSDVRVRVANGYLSVDLGSVTSFPSTINWDQNLYLSINIGGTTGSGSITWDGEMSPRLHLTGVPYAFRAGQLAQYNSTTGFTSTLSILQPTGGNQLFQLPDEGAAGTYTILTTGNGVALQATTPGSQQTGNYNISGTGLLSTLDATGAGSANTLAIGGSGSSTGAINIGATATSGTVTVGGTSETGTITIGQYNGTSTSTVNIGANAGASTTQTINIASSSNGTNNVTIGSTNGSSTTTLNGGTGNINLNTNQSGAGTIVKTVTNNSSSAFEVQNASAASLFQVDTANNNIYIGGNNSGALQAWTTNSTSIPTASSGAESVTSNGYIYYIGGGQNGSPSSSAVSYAPIGSNGSVGSWTNSGNTLPVGLNGLTGLLANGFVYAMGGATTGPTSGVATVYYARLNADGSVGSWNTNANALPAAVDYATSVTANGYVYVIGGINTSGSQVSTVYYAKLNADGSVGSWSTNTHALPAGLDGSTTVVANGYVYVIGGYNGSATVNTVYHAPLNSDGSIGSWTSDAQTLPVNTSGATGVVADGYVYVIGGTSGSSCMTSIYYAPLGSGGSLGAWLTNANVLPNTLCTGSTVVANGYIYYLGGTTNASQTTSVSTIYYASTQRVQIGGSLDLVGLGGQSLTSPGSSGLGSTGGDLTAGNVTAVGLLQVQGQATFAQGLSTTGNFTVNGNSSFRPSTDSTTAFQVQNAAGTSILNVDTSNDLLKFNASGASTSASIATINAPSSFTGNWFDLQQNGTSYLQLKSVLNGGYYEPELYASNSAQPGGAAINLANSNGFLRVLPSSDGTTYLQSSQGNMQFGGNNGAQGTNATFNFTNAEFGNTVGTPYGGFGAYSNLLTYSDTFQNAAWNKSANVSPSDNSTTAPNDTNTGDTVTISSTSNYLLQTVAVSASTAYTFSWWAKAGTATPIAYSVYDATHSAEITGTVAYTLSNGWQRYSVTFTTPAGCTSINIYPIRDSGTGSTGTVYLWGAQVVQGTTPGNYVPTLGTAVSTAQSGLDVQGNTLLQDYTDSTTAFQVQNASGTDVVNVDTINSKVTLQASSDTNPVLVVSASNGTPTLEVRSGSSGANDTFVGLASGASNTTAGGGFNGLNNTGLGFKALNLNSTGYANTAVGMDALSNNTTGNSLTAVGVNTLSSNISGTEDTAVGVSALNDNHTGQYNTAVGNLSLQKTDNSSTGASYNTGVGYAALAQNDTGQYNTAIGFAAGDNNILSNNSGNTFIGYNAGGTDGDNFVPINGMQDATAIGWNAQVQESNSLVLGAIQGYGTNVGIGTTIPLNQFSVSPVYYNSNPHGEFVYDTSGGTTITGLNTSWTSALVGKQIILSDGEFGTIVSVGSQTSMTLDSSISAILLANAMHYRIQNVGFQVTNNGTVGIGTYSSLSNAPQLSIASATSDVSSTALNITNSSGQVSGQFLGDGTVNLGGNGSYQTYGYSSGFTSGGNGYYQSGSLPHPTEMLSAQKITTSSGGLVNSLSVYVGSVQTAANGNQGQMAIYADNGGGTVPGSYIASTAETALLPNVWNTWQLTTSVSLAPSTVYWLVYWTNDNTNDFKNAQSYDANGSATWVHSNTGTWNCSSSCTNGMPNSWPSNDGGGNFAFSIYATISDTQPALQLQGSNGAALFRNTTNGASAFQVQTSGGNTLLGVDTSGNSVNIGATGSLALASTTNINTTSDTGSTQTTNIGSSAKAANAVNIEAGNTGGINIGNGNTNHTVNIATGTGTQTVTVGSGSGASATTIQGGTGNVAVNTGAATGNTGSIVIESGDSSSGTSGNVAIDTGVSAVSSGTNLENDTFEGSGSGSADGWANSWDTSSVNFSAAQHHGGSYSLAAVSTGVGTWGIAAPWPGPVATPGQVFNVTAWVRGTSAQTINLWTVWTGGAGGHSVVGSITDSTTGWTEITGQVVAPAGTTGIEVQIVGNDLGSVATTYVDDVTIDGGTSTPAVLIGASNAASVLIGNENEVGTTSIQGGAGGIVIGTTASTGTITLGHSTSSNEIDIGNAATTNTQTINIGTGATGSGVDAVTIGSTNAGSNTTIQGGTGANAVSVQAGTGGTISLGTVNNNSIAIGTATVGGTITVGGTGTDGNIVIGQYNGALASLIDIGANAGASSTQTVDIATSNAGINNVLIGSGNSTSATTIKGGTGSNAIALTTGTNGSIAETANGTGNINLITSSSLSGTRVQTTTNSDTAFQIQNSSANSLLNFNNTGTPGLTVGNYGNMLLDSEQFNVPGVWDTGGSLNVPNDDSAAAPNGTNSASTITTTGSSNYLRQQVSVSASTTYTFSFYAKAGTMSPDKYSIVDNTHSADIVAATSYAASGSWQRFSVTFTTPAGDTSILVYPIRDSGGTSTGTVYLWGAQLVPGSSTEPYVPTQAATATATSVNATIGGDALVRSISNDTTAFQVQDASGNNLLGIDTSGDNVNLGSTGSQALNSTVNIANSSSNVQTVNLGSTSSTSSTLIQGGTSATAIQLQSASGGTISIGNNGVANTIQLGQTGTAAVTQTVNIGNGGAGSTTNVLIGNANAGTTTIQGAGGISLNNNTTLGAGDTLTLTTSSGGHTVSFAPGTQANNIAISVPGDTNTTDTLCLLTANNCASSGPKTATEIVAMGSTSCSTPNSVASNSTAGADYVASGCSAQTAINNAISALPANGGVVYLRDGTYIVSGSINVPSNVTLTGVGANTIIELENSIASSTDLIASSGTPTRVNISNLKIDGNKANQSGALNDHGINMAAGTPGVSIDKVQIVNVYNNSVNTGAINITSGQANITNSYVTGSSGDGVYSSSSSPVDISNTVSDSNGGNGFNISSGNATLIGDAATSNTSQGFRVSGSNDTLSGDVAKSNSSNGFYISGTNTTVSGSTAISNSNDGYSINNSYDTLSGDNATSNTASGLSVDSGSFANLTGNVSEANSQYGIHVGAPSGTNTNINSNTVYNNGGSNAYDGIFVAAGGCANDSITNNIIGDTAGTGYAINITQACQDTYVSGNTYSGTGAASIHDIGVNTIYGAQTTTNNDIMLQGEGAVDIAGTALGTGTLTVTGGYNSVQLATPATPTGSGAGGGTGATWGYKVTALDGTGETSPSSEKQFTNANPTLNGTNYNTIKFARIAGAVSYNIYRTTDTSCTSPCSLGLVTSITAATLAATNGTASVDSVNGYIQWNDTGFAAGAAAPSGNTTGGATLTGFLTLAGGYTQDVTTPGAGTAKGLTIQPGTSTTNSGNGSNLTLNAGNQSGTTSTGGNLVLDAGTGTSTNGAINIGTVNNAAVTVGGTGTTSTITVGQYNGSGTDTVNIANGATTGTQTIHIATAATGSGVNNVTIGSTNSTSSTTIQGGTGSSAILLQAGNSGSITIGNQSSSTANIINIGNTTAAITNSDNVNINTSTGANTGVIQLGGSGMGISDILSGSATTPKEIVKSLTDNTGAFQVQNSGGSAVLNVDTTDKFVGINTSTPGASLDVGTGSPAFFDGFETGSMSPFTTSTPSNWFITSSPTYSGSYAVQGNNGSQNTTYTMSLVETLSSAGTVSFYYNCGWTYNVTLTLKVDSTSNSISTGCTGLSNNSTWTYASFAVPSGTHTITWNYNGASGSGMSQFNWTVDNVTVTNAGNATTALFNGGNVGIGTYFPNDTLDVAGNAHFENSSNTTSAFQVQDASGNNVLNIDTTKDITTTTELQVGSAANVGASGRLFSDGFETGNASVWTGGTGGSGTISYDTATVYSGKYSLKLATSSNGAYAQTTVASSSTIYARSYFDVTTLGNPTVLEDLGTGAIGSGTHLYVYLGASGDLCYNYNAGAATGCSTTAPSTSAWHKLEVEYVAGSGANGVLQVYLDNSLVTSNSNAINISNGAWTSNITNFALGNNTSSAATVYYDDAVAGTVATGNSSSAYIADSLHVSGTSSFGSPVLIQPANNTTTAFQVQNSSGSNLLSVDTSGNNVNLGSTGSQALSSTVNVATSTGSAQTVNVGSIYSGSSTTLQAGGSSAALTNSGGLAVQGSGSLSGTTAINVTNSNSVSLAKVLDDGTVSLGIGPGGTNYGLSTLGSNPGGSFDGMLNAQQITTTAGGTASSISYYDADPNAVDNIQMGIYADNGSNQPSTYIASTSAVSPGSSSGWRTLPINATLAASTKYWLVYWTNSTGAYDESYYNTTGNWCHISATFGSGADNGLPASIASPTCSASVQWSIYVTVNTSGNAALSINSSGVLTATGTATLKNAQNSTSAFQVQNASGNNVFNVDTTANSNQGQVVLGTASTNNAQLQLYNSTNSNTLTILSGATAASGGSGYTLTLPTTGGSGTQCLESTGGSTVSATALTFAACGAGVTLQLAYNTSAGASPSILETSSNGAVTIQSANSGGITGSGELFGVHAAKSGDTLGNSIFSVTADNKVTVGSNGNIAGALVLQSATTGSGITLENTSTSGSAYTLTLPTASASAGNLCLESTSGAPGGTTNLQFSACANANVSITHVNDWSNTASPLSVSPTTVGDLLVVSISETSTTGTTVSGGGVTTWTNAVNNTGASGTGKRNEIWFGTVTSTGSSNITVSNTTGLSDVTASEYTAVGVSASTSYGVNVSSTNNGTSATVTYPNLAAQTSGELYYGFAQATNSSSGTNGTPAGFTYYQTAPTTHNLIAYNPSLTGASSYQPSGTQGSSATFNTTGVIFEAFITNTAINNSTSIQSANFYVQAAVANSVAGTLQANGTGDILDLLNTSGKLIANFTNNAQLVLGNQAGAINGSLVFQDGADSNSVTINAPGTVGAPYSLTLPAVVPGPGLCLGTSATSASQLVFSTCTQVAGAVISYTNNHWDADSSGTTGSLSVSPSSVGDLLLVSVDDHSDGTAVGCLSGGGVSTWSKITTVYNGLTGANKRSLQMWRGVVTTAGSATITTYASNCSTGVNVYEIATTEYSISNAAASWNVDVSGSQNNTTSSTSITMPSLTPQESNEMYVGFGWSSNGNANGGTTSGFTYTATGAVSYWTEDGTINGGTPTQPNMTQSTSGASLSVAVFIVGFGSNTALLNSTGQQSGNFYIQSTASGHVSGILKANGADALDIQDASGNTVDSFSSNGSLTIQDSSANQVFAANTSTKQVIVGSGTANSNAVLLLLNNYNQTSDPTEVDGAMYYNTTMKQFRCGVNGFWSSCGVNDIQYGFSFTDDFLSGNLGSGSIVNVGSLGWNMTQSTSCTTKYNQAIGPAASHDHPGVLDMLTGATSGNGCTMTQGGTAAGTPTLNDIISTGDDLKFTAAVDSVSHGTFRIGFNNSTSNTAPTSGVWFEYDNTQDATHWRYCYANNAAATCASTTDTISANTWYNLEIRIVSSTAVTFILTPSGGSSETHALTGITYDPGTTNKLGPMSSCFATSSNAYNCLIDYYQYQGYTTATGGR
jgi:Carbohydrate binding domain